MGELLHWIDENIVGIIIFFFFFGGSIVEGTRRILGARAAGKISRLKAQLAASEAQLARTEGLLDKAASGRSLPELEMFESAATAGRMARLLGLVQGADTAWPQLADGLRDQIDTELTAYHTVPVPKALEGKKKGRK